MKEEDRLRRLFAIAEDKLDLVLDMDVVFFKDVVFRNEAVFLNGSRFLKDCERATAKPIL